MRVLKILLSYYFINLWSKLGPTKFIKLYKLLIYRGSTVYGIKRFSALENIVIVVKQENRICMFLYYS